MKEKGSKQAGNTQGRNEAQREEGGGGGDPTLVKLT